MSQHATLTAERWGRFTLDQQVLMIANELNRASKLFRPADQERFRNSLARVLELADLTIAIGHRPAFRREMLRWRDLVARLYIEGGSDTGALRAAFAALLLMTPAAARQRPLLASLP